MFQVMKALFPGLRQAATLCVAGLSATAVRADVFTLVSSYEPGETGLTLTPNAGDAGLSLAIVAGGVGGVPSATQGTHVLRLTISNEADRKVEFRHDWSAPAYSLEGATALLLDVYIATPGAIPGIIGVWSPNWNPPNHWQPATGLPTTTGSWKTITLDVSQRSQAGLDYIHALVFENLAGTSGTIYIDNLRLLSPGGAQTVRGVAANGLAEHNEVHWRPSGGAEIDGYHVYRSESEFGPFTRLTNGPISGPPYLDAVGAARPTYFYLVTSTAGEEESAPSETVWANYNGMTDDEMLDMVQEAYFRYFWDGGHPVCGLAREGINTGHPSDTVTTGGTGFGIMAICVAIERGWITRQAGAQRVYLISDFLANVATRYHGAWAHHVNGVTGATIPFAGPADNGGDLVETGFLIQGLLTARQYFDDPNDPLETALRGLITELWEGVDWSWYRRFPNGDVLYWNWSPTHGWEVNLPIRGYNETQIVYMLAIASPTHPVPASLYYTGWAGGSGYANGNFYFGHQQWIGEPLGGPLFFTHYSNLGFDPRYKRDPFGNYFLNGRNITRINRAYCIENPQEFAGYNALSWGLTASQGATGYWPHSPTQDRGNIAPTAALSAMPYTPDESIATIRHFFDRYGATLWGTYGFRDAFNPSVGWTSGGWLAIDQGPVVVMIENHRTGKPWKWFMSIPELDPMMQAIGMYFEVDYDEDGDVDFDDLAVFLDCLGGPDVNAPGACGGAVFGLSDLDDDGDADLADAAIFQQLFTGP